MPENNKKKINISMLKWVLVPLLMICIFIRDVERGEVKQGWLPAGEVQGAHTENTEYTKYLVERPKSAEFNWKGDGLITLWFDDAWKTQYTVAYPIVEKYGFKAAIAVSSNYPGYEDYINWNELRELQTNGWEVSAHSINHDCSYNLKGTEYIKSEIVKSKEKLIQEGLDIKYYVTPCGVESKEIVDIVKQNYQGFRKIGYNINSLPVKDSYNLVVIPADGTNTLGEIYRWIQQAKDKKQWLILMFHQIDNKSYKYGLSPEIFEDVLKRISDLKMTVVTPSQALSTMEVTK
jgi:peptidoglycan/xylan/chitin deacetylase (PgdA/CDA1 family)